MAIQRERTQRIICTAGAFQRITQSNPEVELTLRVDYSRSQRPPPSKAKIAAIIREFELPIFCLKLHSLPLQSITTLALGSSVW
jgi:hypothetical protein